MQTGEPSHRRDQTGPCLFLTRLICTAITGRMMSGSMTSSYRPQNRRGEADSFVSLLTGTSTVKQLPDGLVEPPPSPFFSSSPTFALPFSALPLWPCSASGKLDYHDPNREDVRVRNGSLSVRVRISLTLPILDFGVLCSPYP